MNIESLKMMSTMLREVQAGTWKPDKGGDTEAVDDMLKARIEFDLYSWALPDDDQHCGFSACAVGHACLDSRFDLELKAETDAGEFMSYPVLGELNGWSAVEWYFGINASDAKYLFDDDFYEGEPSPETVANRIDDFIEFGGQP